MNTKWGNRLIRLAIYCLVMAGGVMAMGGPLDVVGYVFLLFYLVGVCLMMGIDPPNLLGVKKRRRRPRQNPPA